MKKIAFLSIALSVLFVQCQSQKKIARPATETLDEDMVTSTIAGISGNQWQFEKMLGPGGLENILAEKATINFNEADKKLTGFGGCNRFFGGITISAGGQSGDLQTGNIGSTMMACPNMEFEHNLLKTLGEVTRYEIRNKRLLLFKTNEQVFELTAILA